MAAAMLNQQKNSTMNTPRPMIHLGMRWPWSVKATSAPRWVQVSSHHGQSTQTQHCEKTPADSPKRAKDMLRSRSSSGSSPHSTTDVA